MQPFSITSISTLSLLLASLAFAADEVAVQAASVTQIQSNNTHNSIQQTEIGKIAGARGQNISITIHNIDIIQQQVNATNGEQLTQVGAIIGDFITPIRANITVMNNGFIVQEQNASNNARQTVRLGVLTNGTYYP